MEVIIRFIVGALVLEEGIRDFLYRKVSLLVIIVIALMGMMLQITGRKISLAELFGGVAVGLVLLFIAKMTKEGVGYGDGWMLVATGVVLGVRKNFLLLCIALILCAAASVLLLIFKKAGKGTQLPFISFLFPAYVIVCLGY